jgi:hypothetical protein
VTPTADPRPIRLLLAVDSLEVGGAERHVVDLARALHRKGHEVEVACSVAGELAGPLKEAEVPVRPLTRRLVKRRVSPAYARGMRRVLIWYTPTSSPARVPPRSLP